MVSPQFPVRRACASASVQGPAIKRIAPALETGLTEGVPGFSEYLFL
jgi:hypothetical protein